MYVCMLVSGMVFIYMYMYYNAITLCYRCTDEAHKVETLDIIQDIFLLE